MHKVTSTGGIDVGYELYGPEDGEPLILIMGLGGVAAMWKLVADGLAARGYRVATPDNRGVGATFVPRDHTFTIADMAADVLAVADDCGFATFHLAGLSMGGMISQELVLTVPDRIRSVTLMATSPGFATMQLADAPTLPSPDPDALGALMNPIDKADPRGSAIKTFSLMCGPGFADRHMERIEFLIEIGADHPMPARGYAAQMQAVLPWTSWPGLVDVTTPALVIHGDADALLPVGNGELIAGRIPGARLEVLPGAGHLLFVEEPDRVVDLVDTHATATR